ncbi:hypothetical protein JR316_0002467 [Psilocybe cubensis]|uniref:Uncharacterized protein n=2 Tax=Psilocybe cubensis TaxID=181762 RepID=A0ACB8HD29_PSICU|nr:hypothetical protein JR316_0002467 [Psilocybe cubensis]KAH9485557.1 hypothetical protein JR316_0002467 [Psilocybe cubensis]
MSEAETRPAAAPRYSHSKRHASFNSPREVPLPSPTHTDSNPFALFSAPTEPPRQPLTRQLSADSLIQPPRPPISRVNSDRAYPPSRPFSLPQTVPPRPAEPAPPPPTPPVPQPDDLPSTRFSSASLPPPSQIPFHTLPRANSDLAMPHRFPPLDEISSSSSSSSRDSINTSDSSDNASSSAPTSVRSTSDNPSSPSKSRISDSQSTNDASHLPRPQPRPVSPFRAPQPPPQRRPPPTPSDFHTAMRRFMTPSSSSAPSATSLPTSYPPPEPPVILPYDSADDSTSFSASNSSSSTAPASTSSRSQPPYVPFLSHAPPPPDSWIQVETTMNEYRLNVRLPGFSREGITLATKRRRILHVVADSWENGGGHFERRISFGYDADLVQVRAEFDGVMLRIVVPRRTSPVVWQSQSSRSGGIGYSGPSYGYSRA